MYALGFIGRTPGFWEIAIVLAIVLLLFGPKQLPKLAKMFKDTKKELNSAMEDDKQPAAEEATPASNPVAEASPAPAPAAEEPKAN
ncbi:MAG: twin-arginine translocase TatA/TatE family subunit [Coriobacteriia bacterium]|nr:twin-arginine translocase TatA/TatE family subunit [Coriobacteriia bacterium]